jgi:hypothetical protein
MTFDDFKRQFEIFSKIDTAEKLAICEKEYQRHLLHIENQNYFEPIENKLGDDIVGQYEKNLNKIFRFDTITENQIYFLVRPSFEPEYLLILENLQDKFNLKLTTLTKNYWAVFYADNKIIDIEKRILTAELNKAIGDKLFKLLDSAIIQARQSKAGGFTLDGVIYRLSKLSNGEQKIVSKHSPSETSQSGKIIEIMQQLINNITTLDGAILLNIETKMQYI